MCVHKQCAFPASSAHTPSPACDRLPLKPLFQMNHMQASNPAQLRPTAHTPAKHTAAVNGIHMHTHFINTQIQATCQTHTWPKITGPLAVCTYIACCRHRVLWIHQALQDHASQDSQCKGPEAGVYLKCCLAGKSEGEGRKRRGGHQ